MRSSLLFLAALACALLLSEVAVEAATFTVNSTADLPDADQADGICAAADGSCTLRAAIMQANFTGGTNTIIIPPGVYVLTRPGDDDGAIIGDLDITQPLIIQGAGSSLTIIDGNGAVTGDRVFQILASAKETRLSGLTIRNGRKVASPFDEGGGLYWDGGGGHLSLNDVVVESNAASYGGGLYLNYSSQADVVDMDHVIVRANTASAAAGGLGLGFQDYAGFDMRNSQVYSNAAYEGGGIYLGGTTAIPLASVRVESSDIYSNTASLSAGIENRGGNSSVPVIVRNSRLHDNSASFYGGAIGNYGALVVATTTLNANSAGARGGGLYNYDGGTMVITNSTISSNIVSGSAGGPGGGGIYNENGTVRMTNVTISGNRATTGSGGGIFNGFGIFSTAGTMAIQNCTIASNSAAIGNGGGITNINGTVSAQDTIIAGNLAQSAASGHDFAGTLSLPQYDLIGNSGGLLISGGPAFACVFNVNPLLGPLQNNGGPTLTHALLTGSPAIDAGRSIGLGIDQRGVPRPFDDPAVANANPGDGSDIGAFEFFPQPSLHIAQSARNVLVSWPSTGVAFALEASTNLGLSVNWSNVSVAPAIVNGQFVVTDSATNVSKFYRLRFP